MDNNLEDDGITDPTGEFGILFPPSGVPGTLELFEGQVAFESELGDHDADEMLGSIGTDMAIGHRSSHPGDHDDILDASLAFVPDEYLQNPHIVIDNDNSTYLGVPMDVDPLGDDQLNQTDQQLHHHIVEDSTGLYLKQQNHEQQIQPTSQIIVTTGAQGTSTVTSIISNNFSHHYNQIPGLNNGNQNTIDSVQAPVATLNTTMICEGPKVKQKRKMIKDVEHFTKSHLQRYLKRRGFAENTNKDFEVLTKTKVLSKAVFALSSNNTQNNYLKTVSFGTKYEAGHVIPEMERFWQFYSWLKSKHPNISLELQPTLFPIVLNFFFEMMSSGNYTIAHRIIKEFGKKIYDEGNLQCHYGVIIAASKITSVEMLKADAVLSPLLYRRCEFFVSELTILYLRQFLSKSTHPIFPNLFTSRFKIKLRETKELMESFDWEKALDSDDSDDEDRICSDESDSENAPVIVSQENDFSGCCKADSHIKNVIERARNSVNGNLPAVSIYTTITKPICGAVSKQASLIAFGLAEAGIRLYPVGSAKNSMKSVSASEDRFDEETVLEKRSFCGHSGAVYGVHFHPRTKLLFSVGHDSLMRVWDLNNCDNGEEDSGCRAVYKGHCGPIWNLDIPDSGRMIATAGLDSTARIFLPERTEYVRVMAGHYFSVNCVKFHPNEAYMATGSVDKSVRLWSVNDGNLVRMFTGLPGTVSAIAFHSSGKYLAGAGEGNIIIVWDIAQGEVVTRIDAIKDCRDLQFCGDMLAACYRNGSIQLFNLRPVVGAPSMKMTFNEQQQVQMVRPFSTKTSASSLFKVYYKNPGTLFGLGSTAMLPEEELQNRKEQATKASKSAETFTNKPASQTKTDVTIPPSPISTNTPLLQQVLQTNTQVPPQATLNSTSTSNSISKILAARLSQPLPRSSSTSSTGEDGNEVTNMILSVGETESLPAAAPPTKASASSTPSTPAPLISSSQLDAAIASVIDQSGGGSGAGETSGTSGGTITMYASS